MEGQTDNLVGKVQEQNEAPDNTNGTPENEVGTSHQDQKLGANTTPSGGGDRKQSDEKATCNIKRGGYCLTHQCNSRKISVSAKKWKDRGGGLGFGYVTTKRTKYICQAGNLSTKPSLKNSQNHERGPDI